MAKKKPYRFFLYLLSRVVAGGVAFLPRNFALFLARLGARVAFRLVERQRQKTLQHLEMAYGSSKSKAQLERLGEKVFENLAQTAVEFIQSWKITSENIGELIDYSDAEQIYKNVLGEGKGLISMTAHIGNWEFLAAAFGLKGYKGAVLARKIYYERYNNWVVGIRQHLKVPTIYRDDSSREILKRLGENEIIGLLPDQDIESLKGVFVDFFGKPAYTPVAPVRLALSSGAPMVINFLIRQPGDRYKLVVSDVIRPQIETTRDEAVEKYTRLWMKHFEDTIRVYPEQWAWMHNRWKTQESKLKIR